MKKFNPLKPRKPLNAKRSLLERWIDVPVDLEVPSLREKVEGGVIKFGIRIPMAPGFTPLLECHTYDVKDRYRGEYAAYWFVKTGTTEGVQGETQPIKVKLLTAKEKDGVLYGLGHDVENFKYIIRKKK